MAEDASRFEALALDGVDAAAAGQAIYDRFIDAALVPHPMRPAGENDSTGVRAGYGRLGRVHPDPSGLAVLA